MIRRLGNLRSGTVSSRRPTMQVCGVYDVQPQPSPLATDDPATRPRRNASPSSAIAGLQSDGVVQEGMSTSVMLPPAWCLHIWATNNAPQPLPHFFRGAFGNFLEAADLAPFFSCWSMVGVAFFSRRWRTNESNLPAGLVKCMQELSRRDARPYSCV